MMNVENEESDSHLNTEKMRESWNADGSQFADGHVLNGISNGFAEKHLIKERSDKDRHKEKYKEHGHKEHREKDRDKHRDKDRHSSSSKDKEKYSSSSKEKEKKHKDERRDKDRDERKNSERHEKRDGERHERKEGDKHERKDGEKRDRKEGEKHERKEGDKHDRKDVDKHEKKDGERHEKKEKDRKDKDERREKERDKEKREEKKDKDRDHKSSSSRDKEHKSSSKDKEKHNSSSTSTKDKDKHSSSSKDKDKSSSSKDKHSSGSSSRDKHSEKKHGDKEKDKHKSRDKDSKEKSKHKESGSDKEKTDRKEERTDSEKKVEVENTVKVEHDEYTDSYIKDEPIDEYVNMKQEPEDTQESFYNYSAFSPPTIRESNVKEEEESEDDVPLAARSIKKRTIEESDEDDVPLLKRQKKEKKNKKRKAESDEEEFTPEKKNKTKPKVKKEKVKAEKVNTEADVTSPRKKKKEEEQQEVWKWWEEEKREDGVKWTYLEHKGPVFAPPYERLPKDVKFHYDGKEIRLSEAAEEIATFYARMLDHDYTTKEAFNKNFFKDWRKSMTNEERELIKDLSKCNFKHMHAYFVQKSEERKAMSKEEKKKLKEQNEELVKEYGFCLFDGHKEKIGNFKIEPPGLFRGRGEHPKMGMLKKRVMPEDIIINCGKDSVIPKAPEGHKWKEVRHDQTVTWLASWTENVQGQVKYIMLNPSSKLKGEKDWQKYETARKLHKCIDKIRREYREDWKSKEMRIRQRAVALYFIDKLALRAGNEKDEDQADTVGCCSLRVEHISLHEEKDGKENVVVFDFLGKDSIRYYNEVSVEKRVFKNLQLFMQNKSTGDDLFDRLNTTVLNKHLNELMEGLTAKVFRTYNASITLQQQLDALTDPEYTVQEKILAYNRANRAVAILCNHQRAVPKTHAKSMENLKGKIEAKREMVEEAEKQYKNAKRDAKHSSSVKSKMEVDKRKKCLERLKEQLAKLELQATDKEENKEIALGTSKLNYLDPRISVAWCKKHGVPIEKIYNKTQRDKFRWAIDMAGADYIF